MFFPLTKPLTAAAPQRQPRSPIRHPLGYGYIPLMHHPWGEILTIIWHCYQTSQPHCHQGSLNLTRVQTGRILERKYRLARGRLVVASERILVAGQWTWTLPFQIHELIGLEDDTQTLHFYWPGRQTCA